MNELEKTLIIEAVKLTEAIGHHVGCKFEGCTCGASLKENEALGNFNRAYRLWRHVSE